MVYVVIACHFKNRTQLCETTIARLRTVLSIANPANDDVVVTGDVPYEPGAQTLGELMKEWLVRHGFPDRSVSLLRGAVGTFSEARVGCKLLRDKGEIVVVFSSWYLFYGGPVWRRRGRENGLSVSFVTVPNTGGWRTVLIYTVFGLIAHIGTLLGIERFLEERTTASQSKRVEGFTFDGCR